MLTGFQSILYIFLLFLQLIILVRLHVHVCQQNLGQTVKLKL